MRNTVAWMLKRFAISACCALILMAGNLPAGTLQQEYDVVILNGRVIDPESNFDAIRNVGITGGRIQAISEKSLRGRTTILATGLVVAPGFIDLHSHGQDGGELSLQGDGRGDYGA